MDLNVIVQIPEWLLDFETRGDPIEGLGKVMVGPTGFEAAASIVTEG